MPSQTTSEASNCVWAPVAAWSYACSPFTHGLVPTNCLEMSLAWHTARPQRAHLIAGEEHAGHAMQRLGALGHLLTGRPAPDLAPDRQQPPAIPGQAHAIAAELGNAPVLAVWDDGLQRSTHQSTPSHREGSRPICLLLQACAANMNSHTPLIGDISGVAVSSNGLHGRLNSRIAC